MIQFGRKFFIFGCALFPLFACALPNFAALAPTPEIVTSTLPASPTSSIDANESESGEPPLRPAAPEVAEGPLPNLIKIPSEPSRSEMILGVPYQLNRSAVLTHNPPAGQSIIFHMTSGGKMSLRNADQSQLDDVLFIETAAKNYALIPLPAEGDQYEISVELVGQTSIASVDTFFGSPPERTWIDSEVPLGSVARIEFDGTENRPFLGELRPSGEFDGVLEIYDAEGVLVSVDDGGVGENEVVIYTPEFTGRLTFVISGFQGSSGPFELSVTEFP